MNFSFVVPTNLDAQDYLRLNEVSPLEQLMATFDQFISSIRQEFGEQDAGKKFEVFCKWFLVILRASVPLLEEININKH